MTNPEKLNTYTCVHAKKGMLVVKASDSYSAAKEFATKWKLKSTAGVSSYLMTEV
jgi:hypothetical protein